MMSLTTVDLPAWAGPVIQICGRQDSTPQISEMTHQPASRSPLRLFSQDRRLQICTRRLASPVVADSSFSPSSLKPSSLTPSRLTPADSSPLNLSPLNLNPGPV